MGISSLLHPLLFFLNLLFFVFHFVAFAAPSAKKLIYDNHCYEPKIRSVQCYKGDNELSYPILSLNQQASLTIEFDELGQKPSQNLSVSIIHCEADWTPSDIFTTDFFDGFVNEPIQDFFLSANSRNPYVHYYHKFPQNGVFKLSGNYLLKVYRNNNEDDLLITRRFLVVEDAVSIATDLGFTPNVGQRFQVQSVNFSLSSPTININDPFAPTNMCVMQNFRWETMKSNIKPAYVYPSKLEFRFSAENDFEGGNEFRWFDVRNVIQRVNRARVLSMTDSGMYVQLDTDKPRTFKQYTTEPDFNGLFYTGSKQFPERDLEADYIHVKLTLDTKEPFIDEDVYIIGGMTDWKPLPEFKMVYNTEANLYEKTLFLKQGVYNYIYGIKSTKEKSLKYDEQRLEGSHFETENYYTLIAYYRGLNDRATRIIGLRHINYYE